MRRTLPATFEARIAGATFRPGYPDSLLSLRKPERTPYPMFNGELAQHFGERDWEENEEAISQWTPPRIDLVREPDNPHDPNAIQVLADGVHIGFLPAHVASALAVDIDSGEFEVAATFNEVLVDPDHEDRPGMSIQIHKHPRKD